jgi:hypothetical protein
LCIALEKIPFVLAHSFFVFFLSRRNQHMESTTESTPPRVPGLKPPLFPWPLWNGKKWKPTITQSLPDRHAISSEYIKGYREQFQFAISMSIRAKELFPQDPQAFKKCQYGIQEAAIQETVRTRIWQARNPLSRL